MDEFITQMNKRAPLMPPANPAAQRRLALTIGGGGLVLIAGLCGITWWALDRPDATIAGVERPAPQAHAAAGSGARPGLGAVNGGAVTPPTPPTPPLAAASLRPGERGVLERKLATVKKTLADSWSPALASARLPQGGKAANGITTAEATQEAQRKSGDAFRMKHAGLIAEQAALEEQLHPRAAQREIVSRWPEAVALRETIEKGRAALAAGADPESLPPAVEDSALLLPRNPDLPAHTLPPHDPPGTIPERLR